MNTQQTLDQLNQDLTELTRDLRKANCPMLIEDLELGKSCYRTGKICTYTYLHNCPDFVEWAGRQG